MWTNDPDPMAARLLARGIASELDSKSITKRRGVLGEPLCLYRVPIPDERFSLSVGVSEGACVIEGRHRQESSVPVTFAAAFQRPRYGNTLHVPELSAAVGCNVFVPPDGHWPTAASLLLRAPVLARARQLDWTSIVIMSLCNVYVDAVILARDVQRAATQVRTIQALLHHVCTAASAAAEASAAGDVRPGLVPE